MNVQPKVEPTLAEAIEELRLIYAGGFGGQGARSYEVQKLIARYDKANSPWTDERVAQAAMWYEAEVAGDFRIEILLCRGDAQAYPQEEALAACAFLDRWEASRIPTELAEQLSRIADNAKQDMTPGEIQEWAEGLARDSVAMGEAEYGPDYPSNLANPGAAVYGFVGWLTSLDEQSGPFSSTDDATSAADLAHAYCESQGWWGVGIDKDMAKIKPGPRDSLLAEAPVMVDVKDSPREQRLVQLARVYHSVSTSDECGSGVAVDAAEALVEAVLSGAPELVEPETYKHPLGSLVRLLVDGERGKFKGHVGIVQGNWKGGVSVGIPGLRAPGEDHDYAGPYSLDQVEAVTVREAMRELRDWAPKVPKSGWWRGVTSSDQCANAWHDSASCYQSQECPGCGERKGL